MNTPQFTYLSAPHNKRAYNKTKVCFILLLLLF